MYRASYEINLSFKYKTKTLNSVLHTSFNLLNPYVSIIVPGIFGDRGDSRAMFTRIARELNAQGFSVLRFDFLGGGSNGGNYFENDFDSFIEQLDGVTNQLLKSFSFFKNIIYIGFSEGLKFAYHVSKKRNDVTAILSCNGLCVEESNSDRILRPKIKCGKLVYDSNLGTWINWKILENYKKYFIDTNELNKKVDLFGVYSTGDHTSKNSRRFWQKQNWPLYLLPEADHLFTKSTWIRDLIDIIVQWHCKEIKMVDTKENEFFLYTGHTRICVKLIEKSHSSNYILFLHGLFQNKSGPGFLFSQIANNLSSKYNICMFDFPASGDSSGKSENLTYDLMQDVLIFMIDFLNKRSSDVKIIAIASGCGNYLLYENREFFSNSIMLFPEVSRIWERLDVSEKKQSIIDTSELYDRYEWAEKECCILGNILNRSKGLNISVELLKHLSRFNPFLILQKYSGYAFVNNKFYCVGKHTIYRNDEQGLVMSASIRDKLIKDIYNIVNDIFEG